MSEVFAASLLVLAVAGLLDLVFGLRLGRFLPVPYVLCGIASAGLAAVGATGLAGGGARLDLGDWLRMGPAALVTDRLSSLFLLLVGVVGVGAALGAIGWSRQAGQVRGRAVAASYALVLGAVAVVVTADNAFLLYLGWEALTLGFYLLVGAERWKRGRADASVVTVAFSKSSGAALLVGLLLLSASSHSFVLKDFSAHADGVRAAAYVLLVLAFAVKVGLVPVQVWMPYGYAAAPAGVRALLAGVAVNAGFYGLWRTLDLLGTPPPWLAVLLLVLGGVTAILGIAHAAVQTRLERVIAYSSVENAGLICVGYAVALVGKVDGDQRMVAVGLLAATLQMVAHAFGKTLLFVGAGAIEVSTGTTELDDLRGIGRRLPWSGTGLAIGSVTLAGLPPTIGFASEWFLLESLMQQFRVGHLALALGMAVAGALVALTVGFASVTFVRIVGLTVLGPIRHEPVPTSRLFGLGKPGRVGVVLLGLGCLAIAVVTPLEIRVIAAGLAPIVPATVTLGALKSPWVVQPVYPDFSILSPSWLWIVMPLMAGAVLLLLTVASRGRAWRVRQTHPWLSATGGVEGVDQYTPFGYANPTRRVLANLLRTRTELRTHQPSTGQAADAGTPLGYRSDVVEIVEQFLYRPLLRPLVLLVRAAKRLQSGRLDAYIAYMLIVLVAVLAVVTALS